MAAVVDFGPFFHAVMAHLASIPGGVNFIAKLGQDPGVKMAWSALNLSKSKKMATIIDSRPDLFTRFVTDRQQPMVKLESKGYECLASGEIPAAIVDAALVGVPAPAMAPVPAAPPAPAAARSLAAPSAAGIAAPTMPDFSTSSSSAAMPGLPATEVPPSLVPLNLPPAESRKYFLREVLDVIAAKDGCVMDLPQLGSVPEVQQVWKMTGLDKRLKISDVLKERPDLIVFSVDSNGRAILALTGLAIAVVQDGEVPDPDITCPPPVQATKMKGRQHRQGGFYGRRRPEPYPAAPPAAPLPAALVHSLAGVAPAHVEAQYLAPLLGRPL